jgi:hypothetical protein
MDYEKIRQELIDAMSDREELWEWIRRLDDGVGTYEEVNRIAEMAGDRISLKVASSYSDELLDAYMRAGHDIVSMVGAQAQQNLNDAAHIGIKPMKTKYPKARTDSLMQEIAEAEAEAVPKLVSDSIPTLMMTMVDDLVRYNMDFQAKAGLKPIIKRTWSGSYPSHDTKHTDWCHDLAGEYEYGKEPKNVYARHRGCRCRVEYYPSKSAQGCITALSKGEVDRDAVLWNTHPETLEKRLKRH